MPRYRVNLVQSVRIEQVVPIMVDADNEADAYNAALNADEPLSGWTVRHRDVVSEIKVLDCVPATMAENIADAPIYNQPNHPFYGPARRLHMMLMQVTADKGISAFEKQFNDFFKKDWTHCFLDLLKDRSEAEAQRFMLRYAADLL